MQDIADNNTDTYVSAMAALLGVLGVLDIVAHGGQPPQEFRYFLELAAISMPALTAAAFALLLERMPPALPAPVAETESISTYGTAT